MKEKELLELQETTGRQYMMLVGQFYHAYQGAAFALARITGYQVRFVQRRTGPLYMLGFNLAQMSKVKAQCAANGITVKQEDFNGLLFSFEGGDTSINPELVAKAKPKPRPATPPQPVSEPSRQAFSLSEHEQPAKRSKHKSGGIERIYAKCVQLQQRSMSLLNSKDDIARKYRYTVVPELIEMSTRLVELADLMQFDFGQARMQRAQRIAALVRTYATTAGNLREMHALSSGQEGDIAILVEAIETEAKAHWWEARNKLAKQHEHSWPESPDLVEAELEGVCY